MTEVLPDRFTVTPTEIGQRWWLPQQARRLSLAMGVLGVTCALVALFVVPDSQGGAAAVMSKLVMALCGGLAVFCLVAAVGLHRSGLYLDAQGVRGRGMVLSRQFAWGDVVDFQAIVPDRGFDRGHAVIRARIADGSRVTVPGTRIEGRRESVGSYLEDALVVADALNTRLLDVYERPGGAPAAPRSSAPPPSAGPGG